ncbi:MAG: hypothetical protein JXR15_11370 [Shimia sp.]|uniref:hypothetical protein n=1 Tax=Shimia sp. TaxID=1954381 RepID=UPI003B8BDBC3
MMTKLRQLQTRSGPDLYLIVWNSYWPAQGQVRFAPLIRDLGDAVAFLQKTAAPPHVMTLGHGALLPMRAADGFGQNTDANTVSSISFWSPKLSVYLQKPRLKSTNISRKISVIGSKVKVRLSSAPLFKRFPSTSVEVFEVESEHWFIRSQISTESEIANSLPSCAFAGNWFHSWHDWLAPDQAPQ